LVLEGVVIVRLVTLAMLLSVSAFAAPKQDPATTCLFVPNIGQTQIVDDSTILYHMRDHSVYRVNMLTPCYGLKDEPDGYTFVQDSLETENLCANQATIRLNSFHSICQLGNFTRVK
jgi:hypothetical protein